VKKLLEKILDLIRRDPQLVLGRWVVYDPERDEVQLLNTRDDAMKLIRSNLQDRKYILVTHVPFEREEAFYGFAKLYRRLLNVDILAEIRKVVREES